MEPRAHHVLIGVFTVLVVAVALVFALWLSGAGKGSQDKHYLVLFHEAVNGLSVGSTVQYNGIKVGDVVALTLDPADPRNVRARIKVQDTLVIRQDTQARLMLTGITGSSVIALSGGSPDSPALAVPEDGDPVIVAQPSPMSQLLANSGNLMTGLSELISQGKQIMSASNLQHLENILENMDGLTQALAGQSGHIEQTLTALAQAGSQADNVLRDTSRLVRRADKLLEDQGAAALSSAQRAMQSLEQTSTSLNRLVTDNAQAVGDGAQSLRELGPALRQLRSTLSVLQAFLRRLEENPANYLLGREAIQEFQP